MGIRKFTSSATSFLSIILLYPAIVPGIPAGPLYFSIEARGGGGATPQQTQARFLDLITEVGNARGIPEMVTMNLDEVETAAMSQWGESHWDLYRHALETVDIRRGFDAVAEGMDELVPIIDGLSDASSIPMTQSDLNLLSEAGSWDFLPEQGWEFTSDSGPVIDFAWEQVTPLEVPSSLSPGSAGSLIEAIPEAEALIPEANAAANALRAQQMLELEEICNALFGETVEVPAAIIDEMAVMTTEGVIAGSEGAEVAAGLLGETASIAEGALAASEGAIEGSIVVSEAGLLASGAATLGVTVAIAAVVAAAGFMVLPLIEALKDNRETVKLHGFVFDIDGDGKPERVNEYMSKLTPKNAFLYHKTSGIQGFFNHLFKKKEKMTFDFSDETLGQVDFKWKGDAFAGQNAVLGVLENMHLSAEQKALDILNILSEPNKAGNKKHDKIEIDADMDHDGHKEHIKIKYKGRNEHDGKMKIEGDLDGDGKKEKCKWHDDKFKGCKHDD